jgi:hypothetical protein
MAEDRRIALAALAVTAVVGVGAPIGTVMVTSEHDSNRLRAEQAQADRTELRGVLDSAATRLDVLEARFYDAMYERASRSEPDLVPARKYRNRREVEPVARRLEALIDTLRQDYNRIAIRVGVNAPVAKRMLDAIHNADHVVELFARSPLDAELHVEMQQASDLFSEQRVRFVSAANRVARASTQ